MTDAPPTSNWFSKPGDTIRGLMKRKGVAADYLAGHLSGGLTSVRGLLDGSKAIDAAAADALSSALGAPTSFWIKRQEIFDRDVNRAVDRLIAAKDDDLILSIPIANSKIKGNLPLAKRREEIRRRLVFFNVPTVDLWVSRYGRLVGETDFRTSNTFVSHDDATLLWLRRGELEADMVSTRSWNPENLRDRLEEIRKLSKVRHPEVFLPKLRALCAEAGVALVVVKAPKGCTASGATRMVDTDKAMLLLSFRYRSDDQFWFTVFHEIAHLILHRASTFVDGESTPLDDKEHEANEFAERCIVPDNRMSELQHIGIDRDSILRFSVSLGVAPGLVVGQMQHHGRLDPDKLNYLKRRWSWQQIDPALV